MQYARKKLFQLLVILGIDTAISVLCSLSLMVIHYMAHVPMTDWMLCKFSACVSFGGKVLWPLIIPILVVIQFVSQARELWYHVCRFI